MPLNSQIQTYQILTNDDEACIPSLSSILLAVPLIIFTILKASTTLFYLYDIQKKIVTVQCTKLVKLFLHFDRELSFTRGPRSYTKIGQNL